MVAPEQCESLMQLRNRLIPLAAAEQEEAAEVGEVGLDHGVRRRTLGCCFIHKGGDGSEIVAAERLVTLTQDGPGSQVRQPLCAPESLECDRMNSPVSSQPGQQEI